ncbi:HAD-IB family phosphatase [Pseudomonas denitrificans (nom. rej.)]|uniref:HAD-IB family phosphatase n=1 Tax=Pseudomonas denitrificans TaxID=43306 RepID=A0A9X7MZN3_PSEDE|nr:HAD-IB family phosphatase [Pseudomonas denitrificans (nom. rej.)]QEY72433.1 HAD-IB family phosphatase [Pseudomonas denitrificans (nom. rej.)]
MVELLNRLASGRRECPSSAGSVLSVFDFDGTLTRHDSFLPFLWFAFGTLGCLRRLPALLLPSLGFLVRRVSRDELKARLIAVFLRGIEAKWLSDRAQAYCRFIWGYLLRPEGLRGVATELESGAQVTLCSASPALVLRPFAERLGVRLIGTELEVVDGRLTGRIVGGNCRAENKVLRLQAKYGPLTDYRLRAWGDTQGDHALLRAAQDPHWRVFHPRWRRTSGPTSPAA